MIYQNSSMNQGVYSRENNAANKEKVNFMILASTSAEFHAEFKNHFLFSMEASERCRKHLKLVILYFFTSAGKPTGSQ